jgi:hypothetical protein
MPDLWFRARRPDEGQGYSVANAKGLLAVVGFVIALTGSVLVPLTIGKGSALSFVAGAALATLSVAVFLIILRRRSDWRG